MVGINKFLLRVLVGFPSGTVVKKPPANAGDVRSAGSIPGLRRSPGGGNGNPLQYYRLGNPMDREAWQARVHGVSKELDMTYQLNKDYKEYWWPRCLWHLEYRAFVQVFSGTQQL